MVLSQIAKASLRSDILINFDCYVDTEVGLIRLVRDNYRDDRVFDIDKLNSGINNIILALINRKEINPLSIIAKKDVSEVDLIDYYKEFFTDEYYQILRKSVTTELKSLINLLKTEPSINVTFLCESEEEEYILRKDKDLDNCKIIIKDDKIDYSKYSAFIFKYITEDILNYIYQYKVYYFSTYKLNFDDKFDMARPDIVDKILYNSGSIEIIDLYNKSYLEGVKKDEDNQNNPRT